MRPLILILLGAAALLMSGCPKPIPPITPVGLPPGVVYCESNVTPPIDGVCDNLFTKDGLACVQCIGSSGCVDKELTVYCTKGACLADSMCHYETPIVPAEGLWKKK